MHVTKAKALFFPLSVSKIIVIMGIKDAHTSQLLSKKRHVYAIIKYSSLLLPFWERTNWFWETLFHNLVRWISYFSMHAISTSIVDLKFSDSFFFNFSLILLFSIYFLISSFYPHLPLLIWFYLFSYHLFLLALFFIPFYPHFFSLSSVSHHLSKSLRRVWLCCGRQSLACLNHSHRLKCIVYVESFLYDVDWPRDFF